MKSTFGSGIASYGKNALAMSRTAMEAAKREGMSAAERGRSAGMSAMEATKSAGMSAVDQGMGVGKEAARFTKGKAMDAAKLANANKLAQKARSGLVGASDAEEHFERSPLQQKLYDAMATNAYSYWILGITMYTLMVPELQQVSVPRAATAAAPPGARRQET